jgi:hypothetical protein
MFNLASKSRWTITKRYTETWRAKIELPAMEVKVLKRILRNLKFSTKRDQPRQQGMTILVVQNNPQLWGGDLLRAKMSMGSIIKDSLTKDQSPIWDILIHISQWGTLKGNGLQALKTLWICPKIGVLDRIFMEEIKVDKHILDMELKEDIMELMIVAPLHSTIMDKDNTLLSKW